MDVIRYIIHFIQYEFFISYGFVTLLYFILKKYVQKPWLPQLDTDATRFIRVAGIVYITLWLANTFFTYYSAEEEYSIYALKNRMFGPYWLNYWSGLLLYLPIQLLWIEKVRRNAIARLLIALLIICPFEYYVLIITDLHRDYLPSSWSTSPALNYILWMPFRVAIFIGCVYGAKALGKKQKSPVEGL